MQLALRAASNLSLSLSLSLVAARCVERRPSSCAGPEAVWRDINRASRRSIIRIDTERLNTARRPTEEILMNKSGASLASLKRR